MDIFKEINGNNFQKRLVDFGDVYLLDKVQRKNIFWQDVFFSFMCFMKKKMNQKLCNTKYIFIIPVWYTFGIKIGGKHFLIEILYLNRVTTCGDFLNKNGIILSRKDFMERFHLSHIPPMQYNSIISAISKYMSFLSIDRSSLNRDCSPFMPYYFESLLLKDKITKYIYIYLTSNDCISSAINKWNNELSDVLVDDLCVYDVLMSVLEPPMILQLTGYNIGFSIEFYL